MAFILPRTHPYIIVSLFVGVLCVIYIRSKDRFEKEPFALMLLASVWGGIWSYTFSGFLYNYLWSWGLYDLENARGAFLVIGPVEEISKLTALLSLYVIIRKQLNEPVDGLLYMACIAVGYSLIENYYYALDATSGGGLILMLRILICTPVHINCSAFMGLAFYFWLQNRRAYPLMIVAFLYAIIVHGIYDLFIFKGYLIVILALTIWLMYKFAAMLLGYATAKSNFRYDLHSFLTAAPHKFLFTGPPCPICENKAARSTWILSSNRIQKCAQCDHFIITTAGLRTILHHFVATPAKSFIGKLVIFEQTQKTDTNLASIIVTNDRKVWGFNLLALNRFIEDINHQTIERIESRCWFTKEWYSSDQSKQTHAISLR